MRIPTVLRIGIGACALAACSVITLAAPATDAEQQLRKLELEWTTAEINRDAGALERILDDRFVSTSGAGKPVGR